jgi:hypothetical protein
VPRVGSALVTLILIAVLVVPVGVAVCRSGFSEGNADFESLFHDDRPRPI